MMNRNQFLSKLAAELSSLPKEEIEAAMEFYTEFLDDVGKENEEEAIKSLGDPKKIASQIKADYAVRQMDEEAEEKPYSPKRGLSAVKWTLLGIFSAPVDPFGNLFGSNRGAIGNSRRMRGSSFTYSLSSDYRVGGYMRSGSWHLRIGTYSSRHNVHSRIGTCSIAFGRRRIGSLRYDGFGSVRSVCSGESHI